jgi:hypothetical protein
MSCRCAFDVYYRSVMVCTLRPCYSVLCVYIIGLAEMYTRDVSRWNVDEWVTYEGFAWPIIMDSELYGWIYWHLFQLRSILYLSILLHLYILHAKYIQSSIQLLNKTECSCIEDWIYFAWKNYNRLLHNQSLLDHECLLFHCDEESLPTRWPPVFWLTNYDSCLANALPKEFCLAFSRVLPF